MIVIIKRNYSAMNHFAKLRLHYTTGALEYIKGDEMTRPNRQKKQGRS